MPPAEQPTKGDDDATLLHFNASMRIADDVNTEARQCEFNNLESEISNQNSGRAQRLRIGSHRSAARLQISVSRQKTSQTPRAMISKTTFCAEAAATQIDELFCISLHLVVMACVSAISNKEAGIADGHL